MTIKRRVDDILRFHLADTDVNAHDRHRIAQEVADMVQAEIMTAVETAVEVRVHGIPQ